MAGAMIATAEATVDTPCAAYVEMALHWELIDDLLGGTLRMRELAERWLPKETHEASQAYQNRLKR